MSNSAEDDPNVVVKTRTVRQGRRLTEYHAVGPGRDEHLATDHVERDMIESMERERNRSRRKRKAKTNN